MLLPFAAWAITGAIFLLKPGYAGAYELLQVRTYPLGDVAAIKPDPTWLEYRRLRTVLGEHVLVRTEQGWRQLDPLSLQPLASPPVEQLEVLVSDALPPASSRYGYLKNVDGATATTDTGVRITLDWNRLTLSQRGADTDWIDRLYKIHYLQWTSVPTIDKVLGGGGILLVLVLSLLGARLLFDRGKAG